MALQNSQVACKRPSHSWIQADRGNWSLVKRNSAYRLTTVGGRVTVQCRVEDGWVETARTDSVEVAVCETGSGIVANDLPFVCERFHRADPSRQRHKGGRRLDLSIVK
jgi:two-component system sensor histidine kinase BaeS